MIHIKKLPEPPELIQAKREGLKDYADMKTSVKDAIKAQLFQEQRGLCAYCMRRIHVKKMRIEHYIPQHDIYGTHNVKLSIDYTNMLGVCPGGQDGAEHGFEDLTCDRHRENSPLTVNPLDPHSVQKIRYKSDGTICSDDEDVHRDLDNILNLNCAAARLKANRKAAMDSFVNSIHRKYEGRKISRADWEKLMNHYLLGGTNGIRQEYAGMFLAYIDKKIKAAR